MNRALRRVPAATPFHDSQQERLRVLHVAEAFGGGVLHSIAMICRGLHEEFAFHVLQSMRAEAPDDFASGFPPSVAFTRWSAGREIAPLADARALRDLRRTVAQVRPHLIHAHSSKAGALARLAYPAGTPPIVYSPRGYAFLRRDVGVGKRALYRGAERVLGRLPHVTVACGIGEYVEAIRTSRRAVMIPNMLDLEDFARLQERQRPGSPLRVVMAGRICPQKNFPLFCAVAAALEGEAFDFLWVGDGDRPPGLRVPANVRITGWLPREQVLEHMAECHVFMQTSLWEGLPIALLEAMALRLAVLARPAVGNTELVIEGANGFLCREVDAFVARLRELAGEPVRLAALAAASRRIVERHHDCRVILERWRSLYRHYARYRTFG